MTGPLPRPRRRHHRHRLLVGLLAVTALALAVNTLRGAILPAPTVGHWDSAAGLAEYTRAYDAVMADLPAPSRTLDVPTTYGTIRVLEWGADVPDASPVVLLPGRSSGSPMWGDNLPYWIGSRTVYAFDPIGDAGMSSQRTPLETFDQQAEWIAEGIDALDVGPVHTVGHSFGGANAIIHALHHPGQLASVTLLDPVLVATTMPLSTFFWATLTQLPLPQSVRDRGLAEIGGTTVEEVRRRDPMSVMIDAGSQHYTAALPTPRTLSDDEWQDVAVPLRADLAGESTITGRGAAWERLTRLRPHDEVIDWPDATHSLPMENRAELGPALSAFWARNDRA